MPVPKPARTSNRPQKTGSRVKRFTQIYADKWRGLGLWGAGFAACFGLPKSVRQRQRSCLFGRDLRSLWQTDFATPMDPGSSHPTKPLRALARTPTARDDTAYSLGCFDLGSDGHTIRRYSKRRYKHHLSPSSISIYILLILSILSSAFYSHSTTSAHWHPESEFEVAQIGEDHKSG